MFFKTSIIVLLMMQWRFLDITAEGQYIDSSLSELSNDIKQLAKKLERNTKTTEDTMQELRGEENFQLSILTGQQKALENKMDIARNNQDDLNQAMSQLRTNQDEMKQALIQIKLTQDNDNNKINSISDEIKKLSCKLTLISLNTKIIYGKIYYFSNDQPQMTWADAEKFCKSHNMDLVSVETKEEWDALQPEFEKLYIKFNYPCWSSGSDAAQEGNWKWSATGSDVTFVAGLEGMANITSENCMDFYPKGWGDGSCSNKLSFICEQNTPC